MKEGEGKEVGVLLHTFLFLLSFPFLPPYLGLHGAHQPLRGWSVPLLAQ